MEKSKFIKTILLAVVIVGGIWILVHRDQISKPADALALLQQQIGQAMNLDGNQQNTPIMPEPNIGTPPVANSLQHFSNPGIPRLPSATVGSRGPVGQLASATHITNVIRLAVFKLNTRAPSINNPEPVRLVAEICRQYDIVALQNLNRNETAWVKQITGLMNQMGAVGLEQQPLGGPALSSDYIAISDRGQRSNEKQTVIIFNRQTVQLDHSKWYVVKDPDDLFRHPPMVAWFRTRGVAPEQAFTFSVACLEVDPIKPSQELAQMGTLMRAIRNDGRGEDDVILIGDFQADDRGLDAIRHQAGLGWVVNSRNTNVQQDRQFDNIVFAETPTTEFTGRGGVLDFPRQYGIQPVDAAALADRLPIWAEFSVFENGQDQRQIPGRIAHLPDEIPSPAIQQ